LHPCLNGYAAKQPTNSSIEQAIIDTTKGGADNNGIVFLLHVTRKTKFMAWMQISSSDKSKSNARQQLAHS